MGKKNNLLTIYKRLFLCFGQQHWWPADNAFEVMVGAILTQNTSWRNVEKVIGNLKKNNLLELKKLSRLSPKKLASLIKPAGYYNLKAGRLKCFLEFLRKSYAGNLKKMSAEPMLKLRQKLLEVKGIGPETADSILLYALNKPIFVVDSYTKRIFLRHKLIQKDASYEQVQNLFMRSLKPRAQLFNEYHALLVRLAKDYCLKNNPKCRECPLG